MSGKMKEELRINVEKFSQNLYAKSTENTYKKTGTGEGEKKTWKMGEKRWEREASV